MKAHYSFVWLFSAVIAVSACDRGDDAAGEPARANPVVETPPDAPLTDRENSHVLQTSNAVILRTASRARSGLSGEALAFADTLIAHHSAYNLQAMRTFLAINMVPLDNEFSERLSAAADSARSSIESQAGPALERAFIDSEIMLHTRMAELIDTTLLPHAQDPRLKELLQRYREMLKNHLELARAIS